MARCRRRGRPGRSPRAAGGIRRQSRRCRPPRRQLSRDGISARDPQQRRRRDHRSGRRRRYALERRPAGLAVQRPAQRPRLRHRGRIHRARRTSGDAAAGRSVVRRRRHARHPRHDRVVLPVWRWTDRGTDRAGHRRRRRRRPLCRAVRQMGRRAGDRDRQFGSQGGTGAACRRRSRRQLQDRRRGCEGDGVYRAARRRPRGRCRFRRQYRDHTETDGDEFDHRGLRHQRQSHARRTDARADGKMHRAARAGAVRAAAAAAGRGPGRHHEMARGGQAHSQHRRAVSRCRTPRRRIWRWRKATSSAPSSSIARGEQRKPDREYQEGNAGCTGMSARSKSPRSSNWRPSAAPASSCRWRPTRKSRNCPG